MAQVKPLNAELQKIAIEELGEVPSKIPADLLALKLWTQQQPHLKARNDDQFLIQFLRGRKYDLEAAKKTVDYFFAFKTIFPDFFGPNNIDSPKFREIHNLGCAAVLPTPLNGCGPRIVVYRYLYPTNKYRMDDVVLICFAVHEMFILNDPYACICGVTYILDMAKITMGHVLQYTPLMVKKIVIMYEKVLPLRIKSFHFINVPVFAEPFFKLFLKFLSTDFQKRVFISTVAKLTEHVPLKYLPEDYGGSNGCLQDLIKDYNKVWDANREYFKQNAKYGTDESLRPGKPIDVDSLLESHGLLRNLVVD